jgi:CDP-glucose 4,6-dehydratase
VSPTADFWHGRRVLVTGHTGFKGAWLGLWLAELGAEVTGFALAPETAPNLFDAAQLVRRLDSRLGDVRHADAVEQVVASSRPEVVFHLAAQSLVRRSYADPVGTYATNVMGTAHVLDSARRADDLRAVVVVTSDKCYENREWWWPYREDDPMGGHDPYSSSKGAAELVTAAWRRSYGTAALGIASARAGNVVGGGDWAEDRLVPDCIRSFSAGDPVVIRRPDAVRPWQHVLEPVAGYLTVAERLVVEPGAYAEAWNFGPSIDDARAVGEVVERLVELWGDGASWQHDQGVHPHEAGLLQLDASKARARLGWRPRLHLDEALAWTVEWYRRFGTGEDAAVVTLEQIEDYQAREGAPVSERGELAGDPESASEPGGYRDQGCSPRVLQ